MFTQLANAKTYDEAAAECVSVIRVNYLNNLSTGLESALHASWSAANPHAMKAVIALAKKASTMDRMGEVMKEMQHHWLMWMQSDGSSRGMLPLYCELFLGGDFEKLRNERIDRYASHLSMWENESPQALLVDALHILGTPKSPPLSEKETFKMVERFVSSTLAPEAFSRLLVALRVNEFPKKLDAFLEKCCLKSLLSLQELSVAAQMKDHRVWGSEGLWLSAIAHAHVRPEHLKTLATELSSHEFKQYCRLGRSIFEGNSKNSAAEKAWSASLREKQALDDADALDSATPEVPQKQRTSRL